MEIQLFNSKLLQKKLSPGMTNKTTNISIEEKHSSDSWTQEPKSSLNTECSKDYKKSNNLSAIAQQNNKSKNLSIKAMQKH